MVVALALGAAACGSSDSDSSSDTTGAGGSGDLAGSIIVSGSSTVEPVSIAVAEKFNETNPGVDIKVDGPGTGDGFKLFCEGETDISDASRPIKDEEAAACEENGIEFIELVVGIDGLSVMTNTANDAVSCLSYADMYGLVGPESQGFSNWTDAQEIATELGSTTELPDAQLDIFAPGEESGTFDTFVEMVLEGFADDRGQDATSRPDYTASADDNVIVAGIQGSNASFGWVGYAFAESAENVKVLEVDDGESGCVAPTAETIAGGEYPLSRKLFIYVNVEKVDTKPELEAYVDFYTSDEGLAIAGEVGYVTLADDAITETQTRFADRTTGVAAS